MEDAPFVLRAGPPAVAKRQSMDHVPATLRAGSPTVGSPTQAFSASRPPLTRKNTSGSDRLSQLFPSRPPSASPISPLDTSPLSKRSSYPSPIAVPADPSYHIPRAPAPPSFSDDLSYSPISDAFSPTGAQHTLQNRGGTNGLMNRLASLRHSRSGGTNYNKLGDEESGLGRNRLGNVIEVEEPIGYDLSGYDGSISMNKINTQKGMNAAADTREQERDLSEAGYAAEYERLEAQLGAGMAAVMEMPYSGHDVKSTESAGQGHQRGLSDSKIAQKEAEKTGEIVAIAEITVDISGLREDNSESDSHSILTAGPRDNGEMSYFFPQDPEKPSWRPFSMGWPWLTGLIIVALLLAGLQEFLCQVSMRKVREDPDGGLIQFTKAKELTVLKFFTWKYAPILFFVVYGICWQITDFEVKRLEPYYQLSKENGATAAESLNMDYLTFMSWLVPLRALRHKQYAVIYVSLATLISSSLVPVLQSASVEMYPPRELRTTEGMKSIRIEPAWSRAVTVSLIFVAIFGIVLMLNMRRKSGLLSNPQGIAGIAAMATKSHILADFRGLDIAPLDKIHKQLRHRRYNLHKSALWQGEYIRNSTEKIPDTGSDPRPLMLRLRAGVPYIAYMFLFMAAIPSLLFIEGADIVVEKLPFLLTALATAVKVLWGTMNNDVRMLEPFYILAQGRAPPKTLTLDYTGTNPLFLPFAALRNKHYLVALVGTGSIMAEVLTVCVSGFSVNGQKFLVGHSGEGKKEDDDEWDRANTDQTFTSFWTSFCLSIAILIFLIAVAVVVYRRRSQKFMPRQTGTMASVLAFIHQSKMLVNFVDTEEFDSSQMTKHLERKGKTYALGWFSGRDGDDHCGIDEEPMLAPYKYGVDWTKTRLLGHQVGTWEQY
ncbi:hypothetical protein DM02DRAFT_623402 [Periconia macrospinosa]|uniref:Uncharacterized protein n=1 Tax=Periconia macrospinosa TaxID=97972 RepID=A0A2V1E683_9PLEO|nr:hypothetical protein DM02DRAFT_623402 [Periconia macrospinosa]